MLELYSVTDEFSRYCAASPAPLNIPIIIYEVVKFTIKRKEINQHWPNVPWCPPSPSPGSFSLLAPSLLPYFLLTQ